MAIVGRLITVAAFSSSALWAQTASDDKHYEETKGIYQDAFKPSNSWAGKAPSPVGVKYSVKLFRDGKDRIVPAGYPFLDEDRFQLLFELNAPSYVYVVHRTVYGTPDTLSKGVEFTLIAGSRKPSPFEVLYPKGRPQKLPAGKSQPIPGIFHMDKDPGLEKFVIIVSPTPIDVSKIGDSGSEQAVIRELTTMNNNAQVAESKGVIFESADSYGVSRDPKKALDVVINLNHYPRKGK